MRNNNTLFMVRKQRKPSRIYKVIFNADIKKSLKNKERQEKGLKVFPKSLYPLRPLVRSPSLQHNKRLRYGKGFSYRELKNVGLTPMSARALNIAVDDKRWNKSEDSLDTNVQRLREYLARLIMFENKPEGKKQAKELGLLAHTSKIMPPVNTIPATKLIDQSEVHINKESVVDQEMRLRAEQNSQYLNRGNKARMQKAQERTRAMAKASKGKKQNK